MAFEQGTATDYLDLYNKLYTFLTSNADLVSANQQWERVTTVGTAPPWTEANPSSSASKESAYNTTDLMLKGPGLAGQDEIYVSMRLAYTSSNDRSGVYIRGHSGVDVGEPSYSGHVNTSRSVGVPLWSQNIAYWFVANGRRFAGILKLGTVYETFYAGLYLPYATPSGNPYPLMVGGAFRDVTIADVGPATTGSEHGAFMDPWRPVNSGGSTLLVLSPAGSWTTFAHGTGYFTDSTGSGWQRENGVHPFGSALYPRSLRWGENSASGSGTPPGYGRYYQILRNGYVRAQRPLLGGGYLLTPLTLFSSAYHSSNAVEPGVWGVLDGFFYVSGVGNVAENIVQSGGVDHLVSQIAYRSENDAFYAMALE